jgi:hypothetical protein
MRDPLRIARICNTLRFIWEKNPDLRLGQLLQAFGGFTNGDCFYVEDDKTELSLMKSMRHIIEWNKDKEVKPKKEKRKPTSFLTVILSIVNINPGIAVERNPHQLTIFLFFVVIRIAWNKEIPLD